MELLSFIGPAVGVVGFLGAAFVFLRGSADKGTIESLERSNKALNEELTITNTKCDKLEVRVKALEDENEILRHTITHTDEIRLLQTSLNEVLLLVRGLAK